ncbi:MAG: MATE family efflux transporter [Oscillospiraceae bacterium]|nr:MATE family efflux transporter [Oscillospiraceae bacterium]
MNSRDRIELFEKMPVKRAVIKQIMPAVASQMVAVIYSLADTYFVGMLNSPAQTAAVTVVAPCFIMLTAVANLFGVGGSSLIARKLGQRRESEAREVSAVAFWWGLISAAAFCILFAALERPILFLCGADDLSLGYAIRYAGWAVMLSGTFTVSAAVSANILRAEGSAGTASRGLALGGIMNIILDPLFILPEFLGMGAEGAGLATALSNIISALFLLVCLLRKKQSVICIDPRLVNKTREHIRPILSIGFASAIQLMLTMVGVAAQAKFVSAYTTEAVAALGIVKKLDQLPLYFTIGVSIGLLPLLAYNHAAGNEQRRSDAFRFGCTLALIVASACVVVYELFAPQLAALFIDDALTVDYAAGFLRRMVLAMPLMALAHPFITQFQAMGRVKESLICSMLRKGVLDIPLLFLFDALLPLYGCMWVQPVVDAVSLVVALILYKRIKKAA